MNRKQVIKKNEQEFSKFLSYILRHHPESIGLVIEEDGWVNTSELISAINNHEASKWEIDLSILEQIVANDKKQRYSFTEDKGKIRANQGHSIKDLKMNFKEATDIPKYLYHGTSKSNFELIKKSGSIITVSRQLVHLSVDVETATKVGKRHGDVIVLQIDTEKLTLCGKKILLSENNVYLVDSVPVTCINTL